jgi:hypothetical protein
VWTCLSLTEAMVAADVDIADDDRGTLLERKGEIDNRQRRFRERTTEVQRKDSNATGPPQQQR